MHIIGKLIGAADSVMRGIRDSVRGTWRAFRDGPLEEYLFTHIIGLTAVWMLGTYVARRLDRLIGTFERGLVFLAMLGMTFLAFNDFLAREYKQVLDTSMGGLWELEGQMNMALLLMVVVGFIGGSLATQEGKHLSIDAIDKVVAPGAGRFVKRITAVISAGLCYILATGAWKMVFEHQADKIPGLKVWSWLVAPVNAITAWLPGDKYGPSKEAHLEYGTEYANFSAWEDAMFDLGKEWDALGTAFPFVEAGDKFPMSIPLLFLVFAFSMMSVRFMAQAVSPAESTEPERTTGLSRRPADVVLAGAFPGAIIMLGVGAYFGQGAVVLLASVLLVFMGAPLFDAIGVGTVASWYYLADKPTDVVVSDMFEATYKQELLAIPFFVFAGNLMTKGSIARRLIEFARALLGPMPGGLGVGAVLSCAIFAAISGSSPVTVIAIGGILYPMLKREGYPDDYSVGVLTTAGGLGIIIPPSIPMIVFAIMVGQIPDATEDMLAPGLTMADIVPNASVTPKSLFAAGLLPGALIASTLMLYTLYIAWPREGFEGFKPSTPEGPQSNYIVRVARAFAKGALSLFLPVLILGGIYGIFDLSPLGINFSIVFSVTEAAAVAVVYALFVELIVIRELKWRDLPQVVTDSAVMMGTLFMILVIAISLNRFFVELDIPQAVTTWMMDHVESKLGFLIVVNLFLLALGCVMDILSAILIVAPLLAPIAQSYGIHPVHFGIMFIVNLELGYLTPPMGINLFVASSVFERPILDVIRAIVPFLFLMLFCLMVIIWVPWLSLAFL